MSTKGFLVRIGLFQAPVLTVGHRWIGAAALLGAGFVACHLVTVVVTCAVEGFGWGANAWVMDVMGFLAGFFFAIQCWRSSNRTSSDFRKGNTWICVWSLATLGARILDTLMLFGVVKWNAIYVAPKGAVLFSNVISEIFFGTAFTVAALIGSLILLLAPRNVAPLKTASTHQAAS